MKILWLESPTMSAGFRKMAQNYLRKLGLNVHEFEFVNLTKGMMIKKGKRKFTHNPETEDAFHERVAKHNPAFIVCNDAASLGYITGYNSLALCRGGVYKYAGTLDRDDPIPVLVIDNLLKTKTTNIGSWTFVHDLKKLKRWTTNELRPEATFSYLVCRTMQDIQEYKQAMQEAVAVGVDIETTGVTISCIGYTTLSNSGRVFTYVIPFVNSQNIDGCHWSIEDEVAIWKVIKYTHDLPCYKIMQNGSYDSSYFLVYHIPLRNYLCDTLHAFHSIWTEAPKRIDFIASIAMDTYQFWKDEGKEDAKDDVQKSAIPKTAEGMENYWRYNALDCHNTLHCWLYLLPILTSTKLEWAGRNYAAEYRQQFGPAFAMTMRGTACNKTLQTYYTIQLQQQSDKALGELRIAADDLDYNPWSPQQNQVLLYDIFKLKPYARKGRTTDEKILTMIKEQNIWADWFIDKLWECKKPANNVSKYGSGVTLHGRFMYSMGAANTETGRYGSKKHHFWVGNNVQNMPYLMRPMMEASPGYVLFDIDYAQSDAYFTAFDLEEEKFIETMLSDKDTHCIHAAFFFKIAYDELYNGHKTKEDWVSHNQTGVRSITKRVVYGANYMMAGQTLLITMTRKPVIAAAIQLGYKNAATWSDKQLAKLCDAFLNKYFQMYPGLMPALHDRLQKAAGVGNVYEAAFGRTRMFFGKLTDPKVQREFAAYIGQGGTAGNINLALDNIYYGYAKEDGTFRHLEADGVRLLFQVHDSIIGEVPDTELRLISEVQHAMDNRCVLHGREFYVPTEADCGLGWGKRLMPFKNDTTLQQIQEYDAKWWAKWKRGECI